MGFRPVSALSSEVSLAAVPGLVRIIKNAQAVERRLPLAAKPRGRGGQFGEEVVHKSGSHQFLMVTKLPDAFYKHLNLHTGTRPELLHENLDKVLARAIDGPLYFTARLEPAPWLLAERYLGHVVVGINSRM